jgi:hypothetical protein
MQIRHDVMPATDGAVRPSSARGPAQNAARMQVLSVNVGRAVPRDIQGRRVLTAIAKQPVSGPVALGELGLAGDEQADPSVHGGLRKAVYAYPKAHYAFWQTVRAQARASLWDDELPPGAMGENLTVDGLLEAQLWVGDRLRLPGAPAHGTVGPCSPTDTPSTPATMPTCSSTSRWCRCCSTSIRRTRATA